MSGIGGVTGWMRDSAAWGAAGAVVLTVHVAGAIWMMNRAEATQIAGLPDPIYIDLAPIPTAAAPQAQEEQVDQADSKPEPEPEPETESASEPEDSPQSEPEPVETAEPELAPLPDLPPMPDLSTMVPTADAVVLQSSKRPPERPLLEEKAPEPQVEKKIVEHEPEPRKAEPKKAEPRKEAKKAAKPKTAEPQAPESQASSAATRLRAPAGERTAAPQSQAGNPSSKRQIASWKSKVDSAVARHMRRTRVGNSRGKVIANLTFTISAGGSVSGMNVSSSTGDASIDAAIRRQASRLPKLPPHPSGQAIPVSLPVLIELR